MTIRAFPAFLQDRRQVRPAPSIRKWVALLGITLFARGKSRIVKRCTIRVFEQADAA
jgi:hypothetical protein